MFSGIPTQPLPLDAAVFTLLVSSVDASLRFSAVQRRHTCPCTYAGRTHMQASVHTHCTHEHLRARGIVGSRMHVVAGQPSARPARNSGLVCDAHTQPLRMTVHTRCSRPPQQRERCCMRAHARMHTQARTREHAHARANTHPGPAANAPRLTPGCGPTRGGHKVQWIVAGTGVDEHGGLFAVRHRRRAQKRLCRS
jgi:hypothetical protein